MNLENWRDLVGKSLTDKSQMDLIAKSLFDYDRAKQILRDKGYGVTGMPLSETAAEVIANNAENSDLKRIIQLLGRIDGTLDVIQANTERMPY